jgi:UDP-glucose 4-epimerase
MKILLTGGAGYVGSACLRWLLKAGHDPIAYDNMAEGNRASIPADRLIVGDILDREALTRTLKDRGIEAVMHFAALAIVPLSITQPEEYWRVNVMGTKSVLDSMRDAGVKKVLFSSSAATYSFDTPMPITETSPQLPQTPYGTTKLACEFIIKDYARGYGISYGVLRYFNAAGADVDGRCGEDRRIETHLIPLILQTAVGKRDKVLLYGGDWPTEDGSCVRDFVHTDDLGQAHQLAVEALGPGKGLVYNVGSGSGTTVLQVLKACEAAAGRPINHEIVDRRPGDPAVLVASSDKLRSELGWKPRYPQIGQIVDSAWRWHKGHLEGFKTR